MKIHVIGNWKAVRNSRQLWRYVSFSWSLIFFCAFVLFSALYCLSAHCIFPVSSNLYLPKVLLAKTVAQLYGIIYTLGYIASWFKLLRAVMSNTVVTGHTLLLKSKCVGSMC